MEGFIVLNHIFIDDHVLLLLELYLNKAFSFEELSLLNIRRGDVREFLIPYLVALFIGVTLHIYIYIYIYI